MPEAQNRVINPSLLAFMPRQVLLNSEQQNMKQLKCSSTGTLDDGSESSKFHYNVLLANSIVLYLQRRGFSKTLKLFRSEANIKNEDLEDLSLDLEQMCLKYLETCDSVKGPKGLRDDQICELEVKSKKKKKSKKVNDSDQVNSEVAKASAVDGGQVSKAKNPEKTSVADLVPELKDKAKEKKKKRKTDDSVGDRTQQVHDLKPDEPAEKRKDKEKKKRSDSGIFDNGVKDQQLADEKSKGLVSLGDKIVTGHGTTINSRQAYDLQSDEPTGKCKDKKKKKNKSDSGSFDNEVKDQQFADKKSEGLVSLEGKIITGHETSINRKQAHDLQLDEPAGKCKDKKKKKKKSDPGSFGNEVEDQQLADEKFKGAVSLGDKIVTGHESTIDSKQKKKKVRLEDDGTATVNVADASLGVFGKSLGKKEKGSLVSENLSNGDTELSDDKIIDSKADNIQNSEGFAAKEEEKGSKKRKWRESENNGGHPVDQVVPEESKRRKTKGHEDDGSKQLNKVNGIQESDELSGKKIKGENQVQATSDGNQGNNDAEKSALQKSNKKPANGLVEPKTFNAFQRVNPDGVVFADQRLQDNSYWAKGGAENGYGAKAQEILGQVRGRDFRHEKTKKKRGSYRGGQIDLQSHSIKFNYSDEE